MDSITIETNQLAQLNLVVSLQIRKYLIGWPPSVIPTILPPPLLIISSTKMKKVPTKDDSPSSTAFAVDSPPSFTSPIPSHRRLPHNQKPSIGTHRCQELGPTRRLWTNEDEIKLILYFSAKYLQFPLVLWFTLVCFVDHIVNK
ncbi:hypothetical protein ABFS83_12G011400 [Erythranthe nasuta]